MSQTLRIINDRIYKPHRLVMTDFKVEPESQKYEASEFKLEYKSNKIQVKFRAAYITPKKTGQFVTLWKRDPQGMIKPYDITDPVDLFIINTCTNNYFGQFIFPKEILLEKGILFQAQPHKKGKLAIRVYPPWDMADNLQAKNTQHWQREFFLDISAQKPADLKQVEKLYLDYF